MSKVEKALVLNDTHFPFACEKAIELTLKVGRDLNPDCVFLNGDIVDQWEISSFVKHPLRRRKNNLAEEIRQGREFLKMVRETFPKARVVYCFGNHEYRWVKYLANHAGELAQLEGLTLEEQLHCKEFDIEVVNSGNRESSFSWGKLLIGHFDLARKHSGYTARGLVEDKGVSLIQAHCHRGGSSFKRMWDRDIVGYENFCLCDRNPDYVDRPNWQLGFSIVYKDTASDYFYVDQHYISEISKSGKTVYRTIFHEKVYQV